MRWRLKRRLKYSTNNCLKFPYPEKALLLDALQEVEVTVSGETLPEASLPDVSVDDVKTRNVQLYVQGSWHQVDVYDRSDLPEGYKSFGPLLLTDQNSTHFIEPGWHLEVLASGALFLKNESTKKQFRKRRLTPEIKKTAAIRPSDA